ncbi:MAG: cadherin-like domain-containing protein [Arenicellales bacterium]
MIRRFFESYGTAPVCLLAALFFITTGQASASDESDSEVKNVYITTAKWAKSYDRLVIRGINAGKRGTVKIYNSATNALLYTVTADNDGKWKSISSPSSVPCEVKARSHGTQNKREVQYAPKDCDDGQGNNNQPPVANDDNPSTLKDTNVTINVVKNDTDADGTIVPSTVVIKSDVSNGSIVNNLDGTVLYKPATTFTGKDSFTYTVDDNEGATSNIATVTISVNAIAGSDTSINSTSQNGTPVSTVPEQAAPGTPGSGNINHVLLAINDLGMHCGDLDTRISSILPPFNVIHATIIKRGSEPKILSRHDGVELFYSAASNPNDPALSGFGPTGQPLLSSKDIVSGEVFKTNFWDIALKAYDPFYPPGILAAFDPTNFLGLPVPDVEDLYLGPDGLPNTGDEGPLSATQQVMPGHTGPYVANVPQKFNLFVENQPFFINFPFGYIAQEVNWFEAAGDPLAAFDDDGLENPYPLVRVQARNTSNGAVLASVDTVTPISGEANCQGCHGATVDGGNGAATADLKDVANAFDDDPKYGQVPQAISIEYASDINILRLHDQKHNTDLENSAPVVCQTCHYTPALDLAQVGPRGVENDTSAGNPSNGRDQVKNKSMSNVMHSHHATVEDINGKPLFPAMPPPVDSNGNLRDPLAANDVLQSTCYQCHPGNRTACLRGAMSNGGMLCQDCHGDMAQVGDDFSRNVSPANPGDFELAGDFYKPNSTTPRVPWANEPGCGSCHTGDVNSNMYGTAGTIGSPTDGLRLMQAYLTTDSKATPIVPNNKRFAENTVASGEAAGNPKLYRVSTGHEGVFCEACHGATHAIWPNSNPNANDNVTSNQLQGHTGTITECTTCHASSFSIDDFKGEFDSDGLMGGPHGMHPVGTAMWNDDHKEVFEDSATPKGTCIACHGKDGLGTALSRTATDRVFECKNSKGTLCGSDQKTVTIAKGTAIGCVECHSNEIGGGDGGDDH